MLKKILKLFKLDLNLIEMLTLLVQAVIYPFLTKKACSPRQYIIFQDKGQLKPSKFLCTRFSSSAFSKLLISAF